MRIWLVTIGEPLSINGEARRLRTGIFADYLQARGHEVIWVTSRFDHYSKDYFTSSNTLEHNGIRYEFLDGRFYSKNISLARFQNHRQIARDFERRSARWPEPDVVVCSFPPIELCDSVTAYATCRGIPCIIDIRDLWPDELMRRVPASLRPLGVALTTPLRRAVRRIMKSGTAIVGVSQAYLDWGLAYSERNRATIDRVIPLGYADSEAARRQREARASGNATHDNANFFFAGAFNNSVDLDALIDAFAQMPSAAIAATLAGTGDKFSAWVEAARDDGRIQFPGWIDPLQLATLAAGADVGLVCYKPESLVAMPNKIFEYMSFGLPIINSIPGEAAEMVERNSIGLNYKAGDVAGLATCIATLSGDLDMRRQMSRRSAALFETCYTSDKIYGAYAKLVESLAGDRNK